MPGSDDDLVRVADALYAGPAAAFVAERAARAKAARAAGDRDLAARVAALPKPSASAALVNRLVHDGDGLDRVLRLGALLRAAQDDGDRERLRELGAQRRDLLAEVTADASERAEKAPSAAVLEEVQQTLQAVLIDDGAAAAVGTGRLLHALTADGLDPADLTDAVGGPGGVRSPRSKPSARTEDDGEGDRRREAAAAAERAEDARRDADDAADRARDAEAAKQERDEAVQDLAAQVAELQERLESARSALDDARRAADDARSAASELQQAAADAEAASAALHP